MAAQNEQKETHHRDRTDASRTASYMDESSFTKDPERQSDDTGEANNMAEKTALEDPNIVNWGEDDPENPLNWSTAKKMGVVSVVAFITMLS
jgi:hypothetical protein